MQVIHVIHLTHLIHVIQLIQVFTSSASNVSNSSDASYASNESNASKPSIAGKSSASVGRLSSYLMIAIHHLFLRFLPENAKVHCGEAQSHLVPFLETSGGGGPFNFFRHNLILLEKVSKLVTF